MALFSARLSLFLVAMFALVSSAFTQAPVSITVLPNSIASGATTTAYVALAAPAKETEVLTLSSNISGVTPPSTVSIAGGSQYGSFHVTTSASVKTAVVTLTASGDGAKAIGFFQVTEPTVVTPGFAGVSFTPTLALSGSTITGTVTFSAPLLSQMTFDLASGNSNFGVPSSVTVKPGATGFPFTVTPKAGAVTGAFPITVSLPAGSYVWSGAVSVTGNFAYLASGLPKNYASGFWVSTTEEAGGNQTSEFYPTLHTYADGRISIGDLEFFTGGSKSLDSWSESDYEASGKVNNDGTIDLDSDLAYIFGKVFNGDNGGRLYAYLYDYSTLTFSQNGTTATLTVIGLPYGWTSANPLDIAFGTQQTIATYTFTRVH